MEVADAGGGRAGLGGGYTDRGGRKKVTDVAVDDLPFVNVPVKEEARSLELVEAWVMDCDVREIEVLIRFLTVTGLRSDSLNHLKRLKRGTPPATSTVMMCRRDEVSKEEIERQFASFASFAQGSQWEDRLGSGTSGDDERQGADSSSASASSSRSGSPGQTTMTTPASSVDEEDDKRTRKIGRPYLIQVPAHSPLTRRQYAEWVTYWPINARFNQRERKRFWSKEEVDWVVSGLNEAARLARSSKAKGEWGSGAVARPPMEEYWSTEALSTPSAEHKEGPLMPPRTGVRAFDTRRSTGHPLAHAVMNVVEGIAAAERRRRWIIDAETRRQSGEDEQAGARGGGGGGGGDDDDGNDELLERDLRQLTSHFGGGQGYLLENPITVPGTKSPERPPTVDETLTNGRARWPRRLPTSTALKNGQDYLLTGMDLFLTHEPDPLCAMALVHSRVRRVFVLCMPTEDGALESHYGLHGFKGLNHRFEVWKWTGWTSTVRDEWQVDVRDVGPICM